jgi:diacylglycerol kinase family enzyme
VIRAFVNGRAGTTQKAVDALKRIGGFDVQTIEPTQLADAIAKEVGTAPRITVAGGDGTIGTAAAVICKGEGKTELAIIPGGTLNHFAKDHGIPSDMDEAARVALNGQTTLADVAYAGERLFLNTSSVGAYVTYVRLRDRLERYTGYRLASIVAAFRLLFVLRPVRVELEVDGKQYSYDTPLVFIGVGERELRAPALGNRIAGGKRALHVVVVRERRSARLIAVALAAVTRGLKYVAQTPEVDSYLVDRCSIGLLHKRGPSKRLPRVAVDGEIIQMQTPVEYRIVRDALPIVVP